MGRIFGAAGFALAAIFSLTSTVAAEPVFAFESTPTMVTAPVADLIDGAIGTQGADPILAPAPEAAPAPADPLPEPTPVKRSLPELVSAHAAAEVDNRELECLAGAIFFEARSEPIHGQLAVGEVVVNRAKSGRFPTSYCGVVFQSGQFSFVRNRALPPINRASTQWHRAVGIAQIAHNALAERVAPRALFFHATRVAPGWRGMTRLATIGNHVFYR